MTNEHRGREVDEKINPWEVGDMVCFADGKGPYRVTAIVDEYLIEIEGMTGQFAAHLFVRRTGNDANSGTKAEPFKTNDHEKEAEK